ncbi:hypothetical protein [Arthrobacter sp. SX1312]|uniref:hypothetical protein n=1 Tax=Arthrobacter sp. SX1312 TaxID=2058896 RepID=UPI001CA540AC|nr:hypothetical protein [Arthrobacter sp. SX1312]
MRGSASRGGSSSGSAADRQSRSSGRGQAPTRRSDEGRDRPWQPRSSSGEGQSGQRRSPERGNANRRPSDRQERGAGPERRDSDRHQGYGAEESAAPRPHNARDLRSANRPDRERSPEIDEDVKGDELDRVTRAQIRNLEERSALWVAKHLVMAGRLLDVDPELAFQHALAASRRGGRLAAVREAVGLTAYGAGHYGEALREFRTFRRISGSNVHLPVMADCERGLGRPDRALDLARSEEAESLDAAGKAELAMVVSGARTDLGQLDAAVAALEIPQLDLHRAFSFTPRLFRAYAAALDAAGRSGESEKWRRQARVAEKALGLDDELEPDIIDLGEDDEPAPGPVPKVADILGAPAPTPVGAAADRPAGEASAVSGESADESAEAASLFDAADATDDVSRVDATDDADAVGTAAAVGEPADGERPSAAVLEGADEDTDEREHERAPEPAGASTEADEPAVKADPVPVDAIPAGESAAAVQPLQTEMLFSMDDAGTADLAPSDAKDAEDTEDAKDAGSAVAPSTPVEFSAASDVTGPQDAVDE